MPWMRHRQADVWAKVDERGQLVRDADDRVEVVDKLSSDARTYRASARNLTPVAGAPIEPDAEPPEPQRATTPATGTIQVWTDGACTGNPGPAGIGVVIVDGEHRAEISEFLGAGTNNIA